MPPTKRVVSPEVRNLRSIAMVLALLALVQAALGGTVLSGGGGIRNVHGYVGYATAIVSLIAVFFAWKSSQQTGNKGILFHAISLPVLAVLQIGLAEMDLKWVHVVVGVLFLVAAFGLYAMADRPAPADRTAPADPA